MMMIIDGPNFLNKIMDYGVDNEFICKYLSLRMIPKIASEDHNENSGGLIEFVCSGKSFGPRSKRMSPDQSNHLINRFMRERGVHVERVDIPSENDSEKGVDITIANLFEIYSDTQDDFIFVSEDRDYLPMLKRLRHRGKKVMLLTLSNKCPVEIINESFGEINISKEIRRLFLESPVSLHRDDLNKESLRQLIAAKLNSYDTRLNLMKDGSIFLERRDDFHTPNIERFLILNSGIDGYVGPKAASNKSYIDELYEVVKKFIDEGPLESNNISDLVKATMVKY